MRGGRGRQLLRRSGGGERKAVDVEGPADVETLALVADL